MKVLSDYETVFILTPILSEDQMKDAVEKFRNVLTNNGAEIVHEDRWGLKKLAYPIKKKNTGFYTVVEFRGDNNVVDVLETEYRRDEKVIRFLTTALDKHAVEYNAKKRRRASEQPVASKEQE